MMRKMITQTTRSIGVFPWLPAMFLLFLFLSLPDSGLTQTIAAPSAPEAGEVEELREAGGDERLYRAYQKEYAFLTSEKKALEKRLTDVEAESVQRSGDLESSISRLQNEVIRLTIEIEQAQNRLQSIDNQKRDSEESEDLLGSTLAQAAMSLENYNVALPSFDMSDRDQKERVIEAAISTSTETLKKINSIYQEPGSFFLGDGSKVEGTIVHIGQIGRYGVSSGESGTLAPAGGGFFSLWNTTTAPVARKLAEGGTPSVFPLYLFESAAKAASIPGTKTVKEIVDSGGLIAYIIVVLGIIAVLMVLGRTYFLWNSSTDTTRLTEQIMPLLKNAQNTKAIEILDPSLGAASRVMAAAVRNIDADPAHLEDIIAASILHETPYLERFESAITVFAAVAPLFGLLGTVTGMISTFDVITEYGTGDPKLLSGGISEALVTTELGLIVAIPTLLVGNLLSGWSDRIKAGMEGAALKISNTARGVKAAVAHSHEGTR